MKIGRFTCGCVSLISGFDAVLILPCDDHTEQVGTTVVRDNSAVDATPDECRAAMSEMHSAMKCTHEHRKAEALEAKRRARRAFMEFLEDEDRRRRQP